MTERIDHASMARQAMAALSDVRKPTPAEASVAFAAAQVHATLALVEQQRIANLIAYGQIDFKKSDAWEVWEEIGEGLGL